MREQEIVKKDIEELYLGNLGTVEFDLTLPKTGKNGSRITWQSGNLNFMDHEGHVTRPSYGRGNREVELTASFQYGFYEESRTYLVTVLEENNRIEVSEIYPILCGTRPGETIFLPGATAVRTKDGRVIAHFVEWEEKPDRSFSLPGEYIVKGKLKDTEIPVEGRVQVTEESLPEERTPKESAPEESVREEGVPKERPSRGGPGCLTSRPLTSAGSVRLLPGSDFYEAQERMHTWLLGTDPAQWLYNFRRAAGISVGAAAPMTGWDSPEGLLRGHSTGHYLSSLALCFHVTGDEEIRQKAVVMADGLKECQDAFAQKESCHKGFLSAYSEEQFDLLEEYTPYPKIWAPYYTLHKILAGLLDLNRLAQIPTAGQIACGIGDWVYDRLSSLSHEKRMRMWSIYIAGEYGGMNESMVELYRLTGEKKYLEAARFFDNDRLFFPLEQGVDALDGMHANQHIPQIIGALKLYEMTGERRYYDIAERFWRIVTGFHIYAIGGTGESEMFHEAGNIAGLLTKSTSESCATYNMLKLTLELYRYRQDAAYMDYYERAVYNHILSSCDHAPTSGSTYFLSMRPRAVKSFDLTENSCCHGTGLESHFKYGDAICFAGEKEIYVNLFLPSRLTLPDGRTLTILICEEDPGRITLRLEAAKAGASGRSAVSENGVSAGSVDSAIENGVPGEPAPAAHGITLKIRRPYWAQKEAEILVNGAPFFASLEDGYYVIEGQQEAEISVRFACGLCYEHAPDDEACCALCFGPYVLAALTEQEEMLSMHMGEPTEDFERLTEESVAFRSRETGCIFIPLEKVWKEEYQVYIRALA